MTQARHRFDRQGGNLGETGLPRRRRKSNPMQVYDGAPRELRLWLAEASLPWSPASCLKLWRRWRSEGLSAEDALARLTEAERKTLAAHDRDRE